MNFMKGKNHLDFPVHVTFTVKMALQVLRTEKTQNTSSVAPVWR